MRKEDWAWLKVPDLESVHRVKWIANYCKDKTVFHIGCADIVDNELHRYILSTAKEVWGVDKKPCPYPRMIQADIEQGGWIPEKQFDVVVAGEVLEHLSNAGLFFEKLKRFKCPVIITVPNAHCKERQECFVESGLECVSFEHVAWYTHYSLKALVERHGFEVVESMGCYKWLPGNGNCSEGLLFIIRGKDEEG